MLNKFFLIIDKGIPSFFSNRIFFDFMINYKFLFFFKLAYALGDIFLFYLVQLINNHKICLK